VAGATRNADHRSRGNDLANTASTSRSDGVYLGHGPFSITPRLIAQVCSNGYTIIKDAMREVHLGGRLDAGVAAHQS
jgi:hypothetical protein